MASPLCLYMSGQFLYIKKACDPHGNLPPPLPPVSVHQLLLSACPLLSLKAKDLQKKHSLGPKIFMGQSHYRNRA